MGKVQKKANEKHQHSLSPALTEFIQKATSVPLTELPSHLAAFPSRWPFPRGDLYNWIEVLDRFDGVLQKFNEQYGLHNGPQSVPLGTKILVEGSTGVTADTLHDLGFGTDGDRVLIQSILSFSQLLLEKCGNRTLYNSTERLNDLLNTTSLPLLNQTLHLVLVLAQRFAERAPQPQVSAQFHHFDMTKLQRLANPVPRVSARKTPMSPTKTTKSKEKGAQPRLRRAPTTADPNDFKALARPQSDSPSSQVSADSRDAITQELDWASVAAVRVVWSLSSSMSGATSAEKADANTDAPVSPSPLRYHHAASSPIAPATPAAKETSLDSVEPSGLQSIDLTADDLKHTSAETLLSQAPDAMPAATRYEFLHKLRVAYGLLDSASSRMLLLESRLAALSIVSQVCSEDELTSKYFEGDTNASARQQLVQQLVNLLREPKSSQSQIALPIQSLAMEAVIALSRFRQMSSEIISALSPNSSHGLMISLVQRGVADIRQDDDDTDNAAGDEWRHSVFTLWMVFMHQSAPGTSRSTEQYVNKNLILAYASSLGIVTGKSLRIHFFTLKFLENLFHQFRDGLQILNANGAFSTACELTDKLSQQALTQLAQGKGIDQNWKTPGVDFKIPYQEQFVLRELVTLVKDVCKYPGGHADRALRGFVDSSALLQAFRLILSNMDAFGAHTWSEVVTAVCGFLNNEPTSYTVVSEAGIISTLLNTVRPDASSQSSEQQLSSRVVSDVPTQAAIDLPPVLDAIGNLASAFGAICLTEAGLNRFVSSNVLEKFFELFETPAHVKVLKDAQNSYMQLGQTFDELVRHHPKLKDLVISSVITTIARVRHICRFKLGGIGAGPKIWTGGKDEPQVDGGADALLSSSLAIRSHESVPRGPLKLPNGNTLEFHHSDDMHAKNLASSATDFDDDGLSSLDYARPLLGFLASFLENHYMCKELLNAGAADLILDFVTLQTLPVVEESFSEGLFMQDLIALVQLISNERPYLVLPLLLDRARYMCDTALRDFINFEPESLQCYFAGCLPADKGGLSMEVDSSGSNRGRDTNSARALMNVYSLTRVLAEIFGMPPYHSRPNPASVVPQLNVTDIVVDLISSLGKLSAACCREEMSLLASMPDSWNVATRPGNYTTGDSSVDAILGFQNRRNAGEEEDKDQLSVEDVTKQHEREPAFMNVKTMRYLLAETPAAISTMFSHLGSSFAGKAKRTEPSIRKKITSMCTALAQALTVQLEPSFLSTAFRSSDEVTSRDSYLKYLTVTLVRLRDSLWEDSHNVQSSLVRHSFVVHCFRKARGMQMLTQIGTRFFDELKSCQANNTVSVALSANAGIKVCLAIFADLTHPDLTQSQQSNLMKNDGKTGQYFNSHQLLLEIRMESLPLTEKIWDSDYAEHASNDVVRDLAGILKQILRGDHEEDAISRRGDQPTSKEIETTPYAIDPSSVNILTDKGFPSSLVEEALYRCNVSPSSSDQLQQAEEYCRSTLSNPERRYLAPPAAETRTKTENISPRLASPSDVMRDIAGPTTTVLEDSSPDVDVAEPLEISSAQEFTPSIAREDARHNSAAVDTMNINNILNNAESAGPKPSSSAAYTRESIDSAREHIRENLAERCNNILGSHPSMVFEMNDLLVAGAAKLTDEAARIWWESVTDLLVMSLLSQNLEEDVDEATGKKIAANAHLIGLLCNNDVFKPSMLKILQSSVDEIIAFLRIPPKKPAGEDSSPWIGPVLLILEKLLCLDAEPSDVTFHIPKDLDGCQPPILKHRAIIDPASKTLLFQHLMDILPKIGKDSQIAVSVLRVLVILTRDRTTALAQGERKNLQKLFLMMKQLSGTGDKTKQKLEDLFMCILRHIIEDDATIKQIMRSEIKFYLRSRPPPRNPDLTSYLRDLDYLALRSPSLFVEASTETVKLVGWAPSTPAATGSLALRDDASADGPREGHSDQQNPAQVGEEPAQSVEHTHDTKADEVKSPEKMPIVEHPDGVVHFLLSELLSYKDVDDKEASSPEATATNTGDANPADTSDETGAKPSAEKPEKPRYKAEEHPIFVYRCFLLHCLTELLFSYNQTKIEFIGFSRKADPLAATPSKARSGVLNYLLGALVSSGYVEKDDTLTCRKRLVTSEWAMKVIVALCSKTGEKGIGSVSNPRYPASHRHIEDDDSEPDLSYVRRFVLDHAIKAFREAFSSSDPPQARYGRLLCLSDLFHKLITKPPSSDGSAFAPNTSYKKIARLMLEKNFIAVLTSAISDIDLSFPGARRVVKFILKPLRDLTATATDLSMNSPDQFPQIIDQSNADNISSASSDVSDLDDADDREETPDLYRNSALGILDRGRHEESESDEDQDDDDEEDGMEYDEYEDEMEYEDDGPSMANDGEVVSDEELDNIIDGGPMDSLHGDVPMEIEYVVDHHHHDHHEDDEDDDDDDDDESSSSDESDGSDDDDDDGQDIEIEMEDDDASDDHSHEDAEEDWEDEDADAHIEDDEADVGEELAIPGPDRSSTAHLNTLLRVLGEPDEDVGGLPPAGQLLSQLNNGFDEEEDDQDEDEDEDMQDNDGADYDQPFDMMLDGPDIDENEEWGWDEPPPPISRRFRHSRAAGGMPPFFSRRIMNMSDQHDMMHHMMGGRPYRRAPQANRGGVEETLNPLLQRQDHTTPDASGRRTFHATLPGAPMSRGLPIILGEGGPAMPFTIEGNLGTISGHGNVLDAIVNAIQRGEPQVLPNGQLQLNVTTTDEQLGSSFAELLAGGPFSTPQHRHVRDDPQRTAHFTPMLTASRWQNEVRMIFGKNVVTKTGSIMVLVYAALIPAAQQDAKDREVEKKRLEAELKAEQEKEAQRKAEEERLRKEEEERLAKEKAEVEEQARREAEARAAEDSHDEPVDDENGEPMEGVQTSDGNAEDPAPSDDAPRTYTTIRGRQLDITGLDIDADYLEALPEDLREEVITQQYTTRREQAQEQGNEESAIDQEFLDALPEDIREEIRATTAAAQRRRERRRDAQASGAIAPSGEMDTDDFLASLDPAFRRAILAEQPPEILNSLNAQHAAEGRAQARSMFFSHRAPGQRDLTQNRGRGLPRDTKRQQVVQLIDKAGVATLLRLMFVQQQGSLRANLLHILSQVCGNRQTRFEVVSLILVILKEGSADVTAIERSLASLSLRAKASGSQKTPQPLRRTLSIPPYAGVGDDVTPTLVVQQCLGTLKHICEQSAHVKSLFLREVDVTSTNKAKNKTKGKSREAKTTTHPVNDLISLLDRKLIMDNAGCLLSLASLLSTVTSPLASLMKQERERQEAEEKAQKKAMTAQQEGDSEDKPTQEDNNDIHMEDKNDSSKPESSESQVAEQSGEHDGTEVVPDADPEKKKPFDPPVIADHNLKLITNIFVAPECGNDTFRHTIATLHSLSHIPDTSSKFGKELTRHVHSLCQAICSDLDELLPAIEDAQSSTDVQGAAAAKFSASASDQVKLLRVLQALDYLTAPRNDGDAVSEGDKSILTLSYESLGLAPLWMKLSACLSAVEEKGDTISFANILLPLIESLMVVCKHTTLKDTPIQVKEATVTSPIAPTYQDGLEELFFQFTSDHRKILNDIVRQTPKLMQGQFAILVKNSKVLDFDNKRNYFSKQINSRHHAQRHPQPPLQLNVRRDQVFLDSYKALYFKNAEEMKYGKLNIRFNGEEGIDAGGVTREWFQVLARGMFDPNYALFQPVASDKTTFHPSPLSRVNEEHLMYFKFIGRIIGKALHEGRVLDCHFSRAVYKRILGKKPNLKDLESNDVDYYKSLVWILENDITDILTEEFCVIEDEFGEEKVIDLIENGRNIAVTEDNKKEYVQALVEYRLTESVKDQLDSFLGGFHDIIPAELIAIFNEQELELLISGLPEIDVDDWKANTEYHNYNPSSQQIVWFWRIVKAMTNEERAKLLQFITGTSKVPLNGFKELEGVSGLTKCNIHKDPSTNRLPTSHTCFNQLDLPAYESFEIMKQNLNTAISLGADYFGFA